MVSDELSARMRKKDEDVNRRENLRRSLQLTDRVLTGRELNVRLVESTNSPAAYSTKEEIVVNLIDIDSPFSEEGTATILGLNYHEVAHVVYSPTGDKYRELVAAYKKSTGNPEHYNFREAYVVLEENRVETLYSNRYPRLRNWFTYPVLEFLVKDKTNWETAFLTTHGRRYLPKKIRKGFRDIYADKHGTEVTGKIAELIDRYRFLPIGKNSVMEQAAHIINATAVLLAGTNLSDVSQHGNGTPLGAGGNVREQEKDVKNAKEKEEEQEQKEKQEEEEKEQNNPEPEETEDEDDAGERDESPDDESDGEPGDSEDGDGEASDLPDGDTEEDSGGGEDPEEEDDDSPESGSGDVPEDAAGGEDGDSSGGGTGGSDAGEPDGDGYDGDLDAPQDSEPGDSGDGGNTGSVTGGNDTSSAPDETPDEVDYDELEDLLAETIRDVLSSAEVQEELRNIQEAVEDTSKIGSTLPPTRVSKLSVTPEMVRNSEAVADVLRQIWTRMEPGWVYGTSDGNRINMSRAALAQDPEDYESIYDDWEPGQQDDSRIAAVILADSSQSTKDRVNTGLSWPNTGPSVASVISKNIWELKNALQQVEASTSVLSFDTNCGVVYQSDEEVTAAEYSELLPHGGTAPGMALIEARRFLTLAEEKKKLLVVVTDGQWYNGSAENDPYRNTLEHLGTMGVVRVAVLVNGMEDFSYADCFDIVSVTSGDILAPISSAVVHIMENSVFD